MKNEENTSKMQHQRTCSNQNVRNPPQLDLRIPPGLGWHVKPSSRVTHLSRPSVYTEFAWIFILHMLPTRIFKLTLRKWEDLIKQIFAWIVDAGSPATLGRIFPVNSPMQNGSSDMSMCVSIVQARTSCAPSSWGAVNSRIKLFLCPLAVGRGQRILGFTTLIC